jgi:flagellar assembly protein FliH
LEKAQEEADSVLAEARRLALEKVDSIEPKLAKLSLDIAEKVLRYELERNDEAFMSILTHALDQVRDEDHITLRVNTAEYSRYFNSRDTAKIRTPNANVTAHVVLDSSVEPGGCLIENEGGMIDTGVRAQLEQVSRALGMDEE